MRHGGPPGNVGMDPAHIDILVVEDHRLMVEGLSSLLTDYPDLRVVGAAGTVAEAVASATELKPDVVLMDYRLPDGDGTVACERIRRNLPDTAVLFLTAYPSEEDMMRALESGACGYVSKEVSAEDLVGAIRKAAAGEFLLPSSTVARLLERQRRVRLHEEEQQRLTDALTAREHEVLRLMAAGQDNNQIATVLGIGYGTVRGHVHSVLEKLAAHSRLQAVALARDRGLLAQ
jgi:DNA-binding NarL/FixJ family response regulator